MAWLTPKTDCFAYSGTGCVALDAFYCQAGKCKFYKTRAQMDRERDAAAARARLKIERKRGEEDGNNN